MDELEIQESFVRWLTENQEYVEKLSDPNGGSGAICDSIGVLNKRLILIEFKCRVTPSIVEYTPTRSSSIERKVRNSLEDLYNGELLKHWPSESIPLIWLVAETISKQAVDVLTNMLERRCQEWGFDYEIGTWNGTVYSSFGKGLTSIPVAKLNQVTFLPMPWPKENRAPRSNVKTFREIAIKRGVHKIFDYFVDQIDQDGLSIMCNRDSMNISVRIKDSTKALNIIGIWPEDSSEQKGLCISAEHKRLTECFPNNSVRQKPMPGTRASKRGFLGPRVYLDSLNTAKEFWEWAIGTKRASDR